ncbi:transient receptor potential cation channel subfamily M member 3-like, partial [Saccoglossus kowalevskii]
MWKLKCFFTSPITKFAYNCISYLILLGVFSWFILTDLRPVSEPNSPSIKEWIVIAWVCTLFVEEIRQLVIRDAQSARHMLEEWISEGWNILDCSMFVSFTLAVSLRFVLPNDKFTFARIFYCLSLMLFYFRLLQMGLVHKHIGPKIIMIYEMLKDLLSFMLILAVFILSFGIAIEGILYPNLDSSPLVFVKALYKPYWQLYGEIFLDEVEGLVNSETCGDDPRLIDTCPSYTWIVPVLTAVYMLFSNILLINLIIAIFSYSIQTVLENSRTLWYFHRYDLIKEYIEKPPFPAPLVIFAVAYEFIVYPSRCIHEIKKLHPLQRHLSHEENVRLNKFEKQCTDEYNKKLTMKTTSSAGQRFFTRVKKSKNVNDALGLIIRYTDDRLDKMFEDIKEMVAGKKDEQI